MELQTLEQVFMKKLIQGNLHELFIAEDKGDQGKFSEPAKNDKGLYQSSKVTFCLRGKF
jgi:hypothetical protein